MAKEKKAKNPKAVGFGRMMAWQLREVSAGIALMAIGYITLYCTDTLGMAPALVGTLLMASKILDGFTDIIAGYIVDRTNTKIGRGRPYELCIIGLWVCTWLMFSASPAWSTVIKCVWIFCAYALVNSVFYTLLSANKNVYMVRAFKYNEQYVALNTYGGIIAMLGVVVFNVVMPGMVEKFSTSASGWSRLMLFLAIPMIIIGLLRFIFIPEKYDVDVKSDDGKTQRATFGDVKKVLGHNPYIYIVGLIMLVANFVTNMGVGQYYFRYIVGDLTMLGLISGIQILGVPVVIAFPALIKKFSIKAVIMIGCICNILGHLLVFFAGANIPLLAVAAVLYGIGGVPISMLGNLLIVECADFNEWKGMQRMEGTLGSITGFATKLGSALGTFVLGVLLSVSGYISSDAVVTQPGSALFMIRSLNSFIPAGLWLVVLLSLTLYKLDKLAPQIREQINARVEKEED